MSCHRPLPHRAQMLPAPHQVGRRGYWIVVAPHAATERSSSPSSCLSACARLERMVAHTHTSALHEFGTARMRCERRDVLYQCWAHRSPTLTAWFTGREDQIGMDSRIEPHASFSIFTIGRTSFIARRRAALPREDFWRSLSALRGASNDVFRFSHRRKHWRPKLE